MYVRFKKIFRIVAAACVSGLVTIGIMAMPVSAAFTAVTPSLSYSYGTPGQQIIIGGSVSPAAGATPAGGVSGNVWWDAVTVVGSVNVAATSSTITGSFTIPTTAVSGVAHTVTVTFSTGESSAPLNFTVLPTLALTPSSGAVGDPVQLSGIGYPTNAPVTLYWSGGFFTTVTASSTGIVGPVTVNVLDTSRGQHLVSNTPSGAIGSSAAAVFTVTSKISLSAATANVGDSLTVTGTGFNPGPTNPITVSIDGVNQTIPSTNTNLAGHFATNISVPSLTYGSHTVLAQDSGSAAAAFTVSSKIVLGASSGNVGDSVTISGNGFAANEAITYKLDGITLAISSASVLSQANGNLPDITFAVPSVAAGAHTITVSDAEQHSAAGSFTVTAKLAVTPSTGTVGTQIAIAGSGFTPNAPVSIFWDNAALTPAVNIIASATGTLSTTITAPSSAKGNHTVRASDTGGSTASATFIISPKITLNPASGVYGDTITITFTGFSATSSVTEVKIYSGSTFSILTTVPAAPQTDATGSASVKFTVPSLPNGAWTVQATDALGASFFTNLAVTQKITITPATGSAGDTVAVIGTGFKASTGIDLKYGGATITVAAGVNTEANGSFQTQFVIPKTVAGVLPVIVSDGSNSATASFTATAKASISTVTNQTTPGFVGQDMIVSGTGFSANGVITVTFESAPVTVAIVSADATGYFTASFKVPAAPSGPHTIHVSDGTMTKDFSFFMDSTPPSAPKLVLPADKLKPKQPVSFTWGVVTDPSGVTYSLQISQDPSFATIILEKTGLTAGQYLMTTAEKLKSAGSKTPYYWRVKATDFAGNVSPWSTANTFTIGFMWPSWIIYVWSGLAIIVALILGIWIGRRMAFQSY